MNQALAFKAQFHNTLEFWVNVLATLNSKTITIPVDRCAKESFASLDVCKAFKMRFHGLKQVSWGFNLKLKTLASNEELNLK